MTRYRVENGPPVGASVAHIDANNVILEFLIVELGDDGLAMVDAAIPVEVGHGFASVRRTDDGQHVSSRSARQEVQA